MSDHSFRKEDIGPWIDGMELLGIKKTEREESFTPGWYKIVSVTTAEGGYQFPPENREPPHAINCAHHAVDRTDDDESTAPN